MLPITISLILGWSVLQEPPKPPDPERPQEPARDPKPAATLDAELRTAVDAFKKVRSYRFQVDGQLTSPWKQAEDPKRDEKVALAKESADGPGDPFRLDGACERGRPLQITADTIEAFSGKDRIVYRAKRGDKWAVISRMPPLHGADDGSAADTKARASGAPKPATEPAKPSKEPLPGGELRLLPVVARLASPSELLDHLEARVVSCTRVTEDRISETVTYDCVFRLEAGPRVELNPNTAANSMLRIVVKHGVVDELTLDTRPPLAETGNASAAAPTSADLTETTIHYKLTNVGDAHVEVPEEVERLLEG